MKTLTVVAEKTFGAPDSQPERAEGEVSATECREDADIITYSRFLRAARMRVAYGQDADDVAHEAFILAKSRGYSTKEMLSEAARNLKIFKIAGEQSIDDIGYEPASAMNQSHSLEAAEREQAVRQAISQLSPRCRAVVFLRFFNELTLEEIAGKTGETISAIHTCLQQASAVLRCLLSDYAPTTSRKPAPTAALPLFEEAKQ